MAEAPRLRFIVNPGAGPHDLDVEGLAGRVLGEKADWSVVRTRGPGHGRELAGRAAGEGCGVVVGVGGDGTLNEVAGGLYGTSAALGILPSGSGNAFARAMGVPLEPAAACRLLIDPLVHRIDVGWVGSRMFLSTAGFGVDAAVCEAYHQRADGRGLWPYVKLSARAVLAYRTEDVAVTYDGGRTEKLKPFLLTVANTSQYGYGAKVAPAAVPDDGALDVVIAEAMPPIRVALSLLRLMNGTFDRARGVRCERVKRLRVGRRGAGRVQVDGEVFEVDSTVEVRVEPLCLDVVAPLGRSLR